MRYFNFIVFVLFFLTTKVFASSGSLELTKFEFRSVEQNLKDACRESIGFINEKLPMGPFRAKIRRAAEAVAKGHGRALNWSMVSLDGGGYLAAVRVLFLSEPMFKRIVPGNDEKSKFEKGENFWWTDWGSGDFEKATLYFFADNNLSSFKLLVPLMKVQDGFGLANDDLISLSDLRLMKDGKKIFVYYPHMRNIAFDVETVLPKEKFIIFNEKGISNFELGNNYGMINITDEHYSYLDWIYSDGVKLKKFKRNGTSEEQILPYNSDEYKLVGTGSSLKDEVDLGKNTGITPLFSFGTPHVKIGDRYIGVGHIKIHTDAEVYPYREGSRIQNFRNNLYEDFKSAFGEKYIRHDAYNSNLDERKGYTYMMYFYTFKMDDESGVISDMMVSDAFLPVSLSKLDEYKFSLIFPMGITTAADNDSDLIVSAGYGDYASMYMRFSADDVLRLCRHNVQELDMSNFEYKIITVSEDDGFVVEDRLIMK